MNNVTPKTRRLLYIDSSEFMQRLVRERLIEDHIEVLSAFSGAEGVSMARLQHPEVILIDSELTDMEGMECLTELKKDSETSEILVIYSSASDEPYERVRGFDLGAHDFVLRPFEFNELRARLTGAFRLQNLVQMLSQRAQIDGLTGLWNRAYFNTRLAAEYAEARRHHRTLSLIMADVDKFKSVNDRYGHPFGDTVLIQFATLLSRGRASDVACRYGGEEFALILPGTSIDEAHEVAERMRISLAELCWTKQHDLVATSSFGVASSESLAQSGAWGELVECADAALYAAKGRGRNQVVSAPKLSLRQAS